MQRSMLFPGFLKKTLTLSYDDGVSQDRRLISIMTAHGLKGTFNVNTARFTEEGHVWPKEQVIYPMARESAFKLYRDNGMEVAVHTLTHPHLEDLTLPEITQEVLLDRMAIEKETGVPCRGMAYPYGSYNQQVLDALRACGILYSRTVATREDFRIPENWLELSTTCHHNNPRLMELADRFIAEKPRFDGIMFYLWGHSYEFELNGNWNVIEEFAQKLGGRDDIWYATNGEIFSYIEAYKRLIATCDGKTVYNPTAFTLYFAYEGKNYSVAPGQTLTVE